MASTGRRMACAKWRADSVSSFRSFLVLRLVSIAVMMERGSSDCRSKMEFFCSLPSSRILKSSLFSEPTGAPLVSVTVTKIFTSLTSTLTVPSASSWARQARESSKISRSERMATSVRCLALALCRLRLRAGWSRLRGNLRGKGLAVGPDGAIDEVLLFPDRNCALEGINQPAAGLEGRTSMSRRYNDEDAGFADLQASEAMDYFHIADFEFGQGLEGKFLHFLERHGLVGFILQVQRLATASVVADDALEDGGGAVFGTLEDIGDGCGVDGVADQGAMRTACGCIRATGDRRKQSDFVSCLEYVRSSCELLIDRHRDARQVPLQFGRGGCAVIQQICQGGSLRQLECLRGAAAEVFQNTEEEDADLHGALLGHLRQDPLLSELEQYHQHHAGSRQNEPAESARLLLVAAKTGGHRPAQHQACEEASQMRRVTNAGDSSPK